MGKKHVQYMNEWMNSGDDSWVIKSHKPNQILSADSETSDLLFLTAPPIGGSSGGLLTVQRQHEPPHGACHQVQMEHCVTLAERQAECGMKTAEEEGFRTNC